MDDKYAAIVILLVTCLFGSCAFFGRDSESQIKKDHVPTSQASGTNFKLATKICRPYGGVAYVASGDKFQAECRDGLEISKKHKEEKSK